MRGSGRNRKPGLCARRQAIRRPGPAGGAVPLRAGSFGRSPGRASSELHRHPSGRRLRWLPAALRARPLAGACQGTTVPGARATQVCELADIAANKRRGKRAPPISPLSLEAMTRIEALFAIERTINGETAARRLPCAGSGARRSSRARRRADHMKLDSSSTMSHHGPLKLLASRVSLLALPTEFLKRRQTLALNPKDMIDRNDYQSLRDKLQGWRGKIHASLTSCRLSR